MALDGEEIMRQAQEQLHEAQERLAQIRRQVEETRLTVRSADNMLAVVVDGQGELVSITFHTSKWRQMAPAELGAALVKTINQARQDSRAELMRSYTPILPPSVLPPGAAEGRISLQDMIGGMLDKGALT